MTEPSRHGGFSLVEMLVVLSLLAIVLAVSLPYARNAAGHQQLVADGNRLAARLRDARSLALSTRQSQSVEIDVESRVIEGPKDRAVLLIASADRISLTTAGELIVNRRGAIRFFPDGGSTGGVITLSSEAASRTIAINWLTGAVTVQDGAGP